ncbi:protein kinase [Phyllobacterium sp. SB3]|uniref:protein kinase domain-containing protein n=1 Tax=Phyllobacterium sp. SB3 TaxID=3156073 RepID=UPI0032AFFA4A
MIAEQNDEKLNQAIAERWCRSKGSGWSLVDTAGRGGTAPVFTVNSPKGPLALKLLDKEFSEGARRSESEKRIQKQVDSIGIHACPYLIQVYEGGAFEDRLFLLMNKALGSELAQCLDLVPRNKISSIVDQVAQACIYLRSIGLCHRDIKSANVFVTSDFTHATLLDVSVARDIYDPVGLGTDHGDKLPVVATSRYTPPEYLFRLIDPGEELWHAVDVYQLGGLIHDLVMRKPMFEEDYRKSAENRYRFAWVVATKTPELAAEDIDAGLLLLGQRSLDKDWQRRSSLQLEDFLANKNSRSKLGIEAIGLAPKLKQKPEIGPANIRQLLSGYAKDLEEQLRAYQVEKGIKAIHSAAPRLNDNRWEVCFEWTLPIDGEHSYDHIALSYELSVHSVMGNTQIGMVGTLIAHNSSGDHAATIELPNIPIDESTKEVIFTRAVGAISELATNIMNSSKENE